MDDVVDARDPVAGVPVSGNHGWCGHSFCNAGTKRPMRPREEDGAFRNGGKHDAGPCPCLLYTSDAADE